ncbi:helix-turn-helix domain-containing protein [Mucilaginibacter ximonensis]|uniref:Helix-turn-helix domain-containing protein n=1 Tax=Mucilaginibacter ximonensis TaxID=538021 RepID=A0ABW5YDK7_9SPHI
MVNIYDNTLDNPNYYRQFSCGESLITLYNCPLKNKYQDVWCQHNYFIYVIEGTKRWHTAQGTFELTENTCVFVRKGAAISEQLSDDKFCLVMFFVPDDFICEVLKSKTSPIYRSDETFHTVMPIINDNYVQAFFKSIMHFFEARYEPEKALLELKFRELILTVAGNLNNREMLAYFGALLHEPQAISLQKVMESNYCYNLKLEAYAKLVNRSLSAFKRDFRKQFDTTPGKWLLEKRLIHARNLLVNTNKTVSEAAFESGFESVSHFSRAFRGRFGLTPISVKNPVFA